VIVENKNLKHMPSQFDLTIISDLFKKKERELNEWVENLQLEHVKENKQFEETKQQVKNRILFTPVEVEENPEIKSHETTTVNVNPYLNPMAREQKAYLVYLEFTLYRGDEELFYYAPRNMTIKSSTDSNIYPPEENSIPIEVKIGKFDKNLAIQQAKQHMQATFELIKKNNEEAKEWNEQKAKEINSKLEQQRKKLLKFYE
jgi:hypothetical protein